MLSNKKLEYFKKMLIEMKHDVEQQLEKENQGPNESAQELADYDNHPADMGTEQFEQERDAGLKLVKKRKATGYK